MKGNIIQYTNGEFILHYDYVTEHGQHLYQELPIHPFYKNATFEVGEEMTFQYAKECDFHFPATCQCKDLTLYALPITKKEKKFDRIVFILTLIVFMLLLVNAFGQGISIQSGNGASHLDVPYLKECDVQTLRIQIKPIYRAEKYNLTAQTAFNVELGWASRIVDECNKEGILPVIAFNEVTLTDTLTDEMPQFWTDENLNNAYFNISKVVAKFANKVYAYEFIGEPVMIDDGRVITPPRLEEFYTKALEVVRQRDMNAYLLLTPGPWGMPTNYAKFKPFNIIDSKLMYNFHMYLPFNYTHQGLNDRPKGIIYPNDSFNADTILKRFKVVSQWSKQYNYPIFLGEFNAVRWAKNSGAYVQDVINAAKLYNFNWVYFAYRPNFRFWNPYYGVTNTDGLPVNYYLKNYGKDSQQWLMLIYNFQNGNTN